MTSITDLVWHEFRALPREAMTAAMAMLGLFVGSFMNVVAYRLPRMLEAQWAQESAAWAGQVPAVTPTFNLAWPPSRCPHCETRISARHNVPVLGFLLLRGRCAHCRAGISPRYPLVELSTGILFACVAWHFAPSMLYAAMLAWCGFGAVLITLTLIDSDTRLLPDALTLPLLWGGLLCSVAGLTISVDDAVLGAALGYGVMGMIAGAYRMLTGTDGLGGGDAKLVAACGAWLGWIGVPLMLSFGAMAATLAFAVLGLWRGRALREPLPFGPWLILGALASLLWGEAFLNLWLRADG
ncbi:prepilin peptidase [Pandoraea apista]|uniref:prepilin peptidase n=1 Tax=Pandoraea apista TaxID=93218 RepID=UPI00065A04F7|nr:A24 family peptidase [Pandoraea apista]RRW95446.1 prepilin peptidase [Pandoraea apista]RRX04490.1 prepilin peptidase [Pandoraea apista]CFB62026.1 Type 4 prepilin-like proteins leader peptide-processing enzyme [Pandoraea apista]